MDKEVRSDAKLKNLPQEMLETMWRLRNPEEDGQKLTFVEILVWLKEHAGIESSLGALSEFYSWLRLKRRIQNAAERATQVRMELAKDSSITPDDLERIAQTVFTAETIEGGDVEAFVKLATLRLNARRVDQDERRLRMLEEKAQRLQAAEDAIHAIQSDKTLTPEAQRAAVLEKMDEFFGLKKKN